MYFIPRNNILYNYIAHTRRNRRYGATIFIIFFTVICFYGIYKPLNSTLNFYKGECSRLENQYKMLKELEDSIQHYNSLINSSNKQIAHRGISSDQCYTHCHNYIIKMINIISQHNLILHTYSSCKQTKKDWYNKYSAQFSIEAPLSKLLTFIEALKEEFSMNRLSRLALKHNEKDFFRMDFEITFLIIKK